MKAVIKPCVAVKMSRYDSAWPCMCVKPFSSRNKQCAGMGASSPLDWHRRQHFLHSLGVGEKAVCSKTRSLENKGRMITQWTSCQNSMPRSQRLDDSRRSLHLSSQMTRGQLQQQHMD
jgi:hypothetical protein